MDKQVAKTKTLRALGGFFKWFFITVMGFFTLYPVLYAVMGSFKTNKELNLGGSFFPKEWMFENYKYAFDQLGFGHATMNSFMLAFFVVVFSVLTASMTAYVIARRTFPGKKLLTGAYLASMFVSVGSVTLYPVYNLMHSIGMHDNVVGLALLLTGGQVTNVFLISGFVKSIPREIDEAAIIDGAGSFRIYWQIIMPSIKPILSVVGLFAFRGAWNEFITVQVFSMSNPKLQTLSVAVANLRYSANAAAEWHIMCAGAAIALFPILIVYLFTSKQFITGLTAGAVKS